MLSSAITGSVMIKYTLYLGRDKSDKIYVTKEELLDLIDKIDSKQCYTLFNAEGGYFSESRIFIEEPTFVVEIIANDWKFPRTLAEEYKSHFNQECVLMTQQVVTVTEI